MGFVGDILGFGGNKGMDFQASGTDITQAVNSGQTDAAAKASGQDIAQQQQFVNALAAQNGIGNQSSVFNQQQALANQLQQAAAGGGPNPALAQLQNTTGQNVANQAALMAGQRGAGANAGLIARQAAQQGAATQQQAVGQGAAMSAQQQIAARQALQQQQGMMGGLSTQQVGQQAGALTNLNQFQQNQQQMLLNAIASQNQAKVGMQSNMNNANAAIQGKTADQQGNLFGGLVGGLGAAFGLAHGGRVPGYDDGGQVLPQGPAAPTVAMPGTPAAATPPAGKGATSKVGKILKSMSSSMSSADQQKQPMYKAGQTAGNAIGKGIQAGVSAIGGLFSSSDSGSTNAPGTAPNLGVEGVDKPDQPTFNLGVSGVDQPTPDQSPSLGVDTSLSSIGSDLPSFDEGGDVDFKPTEAVETSVNPGSVSLAPAASGGGGGGGGGGMGDIMKMLPMLAAAANKGGKVKGNAVVGELLASMGKQVPGKAKTKGDNLKNDTVPAMLSPGEVVIPRSIMNSPDAPKKAAEFVARVMAKKRSK